MPTKFILQFDANEGMWSVKVDNSDVEVFTSYDIEDCTDFILNEVP